MLISAGRLLGVSQSVSENRKVMLGGGNWGIGQRSQIVEDESGIDRIPIFQINGSQNGSELRGDLLHRKAMESFSFKRGHLVYWFELRQSKMTGENSNVKECKVV